MKVLIFALILFGVFTAFHPTITNAQEVVETDSLVGEEKISTESSSVSTVSANYELHYPGMLPDSPLYFLKVIRDGILKFLINDDLKRARFSLENAEKRMFAGMLLAEKGKDKLATDSISKSNNYLQDTLDAINKFSKTHPKSSDIKPFLLQMNAAILKHEEVLQHVKNIIDDEYMQQIVNEEKRLEIKKQTARNLLLQQR